MKNDEPGEFDHLEEPGEFDHLEEPKLPETVLIDPDDVEGYKKQMALLADDWKKQVARGVLAQYPRSATRKRKRKRKQHPFAIEAVRRRRIFLDALSKTGRVMESAKIAGYASMTPLYEFRDRNPEFEKAWDRALEIAGDVFESEAARRAVDGVYEPVFYEGRVVGYKVSYSDGLLTTLLKGAKKDKYADRKQVDNKHSGTVGVAVLPATISIEQWEQTAQQVHSNQKMIDLTAEEVTDVTPEPAKPKQGEISR